MKTIFQFLAVFAIMFSAVSCGNNTGSDASGKEGTVKEGKKEAKVEKVNGEWEKIDPSDNAFMNKRESYIDKLVEVGGFELGKPKGSEIESAISFTGEGEFENTTGSYMIYFKCGDAQITPKFFDVYAQAVWDASKAAAAENKIYLLKSGEKMFISSLKDAKREFKAEGNYIPYEYRWYYEANGIVVEMNVELEKRRNSANERVENIIKVYGDKKNKVRG